MTTYAEVWARFAPGDRVYLAGASGEPTAALDSLDAEPERARGLHFTGVWLPGINERDPSAAPPGARARTFFMTSGLRAGFAAGRVEMAPLHYSDIHRWLAGPARLAGAVMQVSPPHDGHVTPGVSCDFAASAVQSGAALIGEINPAMPAPASAPRIPVSRFAALVEAETALPAYDTGAVPPELMRIGERIAALVRPGDTIQLGIGKAAAAVLAALEGARDLGYHAGLITDAILPHLDRGTFSRGITAGVAMGTSGLYERAGRDPDIRFAPVAWTHAVTTLAAIPRLVAINSCIEVDLFGQTNSELMGGRQVSGHGGVADFQRGALASPGGRAILALPSTAAKGTVSRIRPTLGPAPVASVARADADTVVTEHGVAEIRWLDVDARAQALIGIAAPQWRDRLADEWAALRRAM